MTWEIKRTSPGDAPRLIMTTCGSKLIQEQVALDRGITPVINQNLPPTAGQ